MAGRRLSKQHVEDVREAYKLLKLVRRRVDRVAFERDPSLNQSRDGAVTALAHAQSHVGEMLWALENEIFDFEHDDKVTQSWTRGHKRTGGRKTE